MQRVTLLTSSVIGTALVVWAFFDRSKDGMLILFMGTAIFLCTLAIVALRSALRDEWKTPKTNTLAILGALIGLFLGGFVGASFGFGRVMIAIFNPHLPEQDFGTIFGSIGGGFLGAFFLALVGGILQRLFVQRNEDVPAKNPKKTLPSSLGDAS